MVLIIFISCTCLSIKMFNQIAEVVLIQSTDFETTRDFIFQELFHLLKTQDFIITHADKIAH